MRLGKSIDMDFVIVIICLTIITIVSLLSGRL